MRFCLFLALAAWATEPDPTTLVAASTVQLRVDAVPVAPALAAVCTRYAFACPGHGGPRTQTGAAFSVDGGLVTNAHVVAGARKITVVLPDGAIVDVAPNEVRADAEQDIAWLPFPGPATLTWATTGQTDGQAWTVGYPDDHGRVSRPTTLQGAVAWALPGQATLPFLRVAGPVRPGDSGGPLVDVAGHVLGVVVAGSSPESVLAGDGLVIPAARAAGVVAALSAKAGAGVVDTSRAGTSPGEPLTPWAPQRQPDGSYSMSPP